MCNKNSKKAFTLSEIIISLSLIGVIAAALLPVVYHSVPNKDVLKFKKTHTTFIATVNKLASDGNYYLPGDMRKKPDGTKLVGGAYETTNERFTVLCEGLADTIQTKENSCKDFEFENVAMSYGGQSTVQTDLSSLFAFKFQTSEELKKEKIRLDFLCKRDEKQGIKVPRFIDKNGVWYIDLYFGVTYSENDKVANYYKPICIDIDGPEGEILPFGYGINFQGQILTGCRADWWNNKELTKGRNSNNNTQEECPCTDTNGAPLCESN